MSNNNQWEFYREGDLLFRKSSTGQIVAAFSYKGNSEFVHPTGHLMRFELRADGGVKVCRLAPNTNECDITGMKVIKN